MQTDCYPVHGKVPGPKNHLLCSTHGHVLDVTAGTIIAESVAEYMKRYPKKGGGQYGGGGKPGYGKPPGGGYGGDKPPAYGKPPTPPYGGGGGSGGYGGGGEGGYSGGGGYGGGVGPGYQKPPGGDLPGYERPPREGYQEGEPGGPGNRESGYERPERGE